MSFKSVRVVGSDFTGATNVVMDPQEVKNKNMSAGIYPFDFGTFSFDGVYIAESFFTNPIMPEIKDTTAEIKSKIRAIVRK